MVEIVNPQDAVRVDLDLKLSRIRNKWLRVCGPCDAGLSGECTHPDEDYRTVIADLVTDLEKFREHAALLSASTMGEAFDRLEELVEKEKEPGKTRAELATMTERRNEVRELAAKREAELIYLRAEVTTWKRKAARLREQLAQSTFGPALDKLARDIVGVGADDVHPAEEIAVKWSRLREVLANPATTAEPADEPKADDTDWVTVLDDAIAASGARLVFDPRNWTAPHTLHGPKATDPDREHPAHVGQTCDEYDAEPAAS